MDYNYYCCCSRTLLLLLLGCALCVCWVSASAHASQGEDLLGCADDGQTYNNGATWKPESCRTCVCDSGQVRCHATQCGKLRHCDNVFTPEGACCPVCRTATFAHWPEQKEKEPESLKDLVLKALSPKEFADLGRSDLATMDFQNASEAMPEVSFPPARPGPDNLASLCLHGDRRPRYPWFRHGRLRRRGEAVNHAEAAFAHCCRGNQTWGEATTLCCAQQAWEASLVSFCEEEASVKAPMHRCCKTPAAERPACFHGLAPNPGYLPTQEVPNPVTDPVVPPTPLPGQVPFNPTSCRREAAEDSSQQPPVPDEQQPPQ